MRKTYLVCSLLAAGALATACSGGATSTRPPAPLDRSLSPLATHDGAPSAREVAAEAAAFAKVEAKLRAGYIFQVRGTAHAIDVANGQPPKLTFGHGDFIDVALVPNTEQRYIIGSPASVRLGSLALPPSCDGCDGNGGGTPGPQPTPPPNYGPCSSSGGATWYDGSTGEGGCTPRGSTKPLTCGTWSWSSRGRGTLIVPGTGTYHDLDYVVDNGNGSCRLGYI